ncbi:MAG: transglutaminase domain-containing protein [Bacteroidota bacterium]
MKRFAILLAFCHSAVLGQLSDFQDTDFHRADSIAEHFAGHPLADLKTLADKLTGSLSTEQEKFRAIYKWVCGNIEADYELVLLNQRNRATLQGKALAAWTKKFNQIVFDTLRYKQKTVCTGFAYLVRELAYHTGLSCTIVNGYAKYKGVDQRALRPANHSWNEIRLNNKWYVCDATWSSGVFSLSKGTFVKMYNDLYFLTEPAVFFRNHSLLGERSEVARD